jgi:glycosyltransferase involved in cell wall biosynthesis
VKSVAKSTNKKICFINLHGAALYCPEAENYIGGSEVDSWIVSRILVDLGYAVEVIVNLPRYEKRFWEQDGIVFHNLRVEEHASSWRRLWEFWKLLRRVDSLLWFAKIISPISAILGLYCWIYKRKLIYKTANREDLLLAKGEPTGVRNLRLYFHLTRLGMKVYIAQNSDQLVAAIEHFEDSDCKTVRIPNVHQPLSITPFPLTEREFVLWVGHLTHYKRPELFIELASASQSLNFIMVASTRESAHLDNYRQQINEIPNLRLVENVPFMEMSNYFLRAQVLVNTSKAEGFPNTFLQAFQTLTPLATTGVDPDGMIVEANLGKVADNVPQMAEWLYELLDQPEQYEQIQRNLAHFAQEHFAYDKVKEQYRKILEEIA